MMRLGHETTTATRVTYLTRSSPRWNQISHFGLFHARFRVWCCVACFCGDPSRPVCYNVWYSQQKCSMNPCFRAVRPLTRRQRCLAVPGDRWLQFARASSRCWLLLLPARCVPAIACGTVAASLPPRRRETAAESSRCCSSACTVA